MGGDCPVCLEDLFSSRIAAVTMPCGHWIHPKCLNGHSKTSLGCPLCKKSIHPKEVMAMITARIDEEI